MIWQKTTPQDQLAHAKIIYAFVGGDLKTMEAFHSLHNGKLSVTEYEEPSRAVSVTPASLALTVDCSFDLPPICLTALMRYQSRSRGRSSFNRAVANLAMSSSDRCGCMSRSSLKPCTNKLSHVAETLPAFCININSSQRQKLKKKLMKQNVAQ